MIEKRKFYIDGQWRTPVQAHDFQVTDPSTGEACAVISLGSQADTDQAVAAAKRSFDSWGRTGKAERLALLERLAGIYEARADDMAAAIAMEMGAPIDMARNAQWGSGAWHISNILDELRQFTSVVRATYRVWR